jgi:hypothetical protein
MRQALRPFIFTDHARSESDPNGIINAARTPFLLQSMDYKLSSRAQQLAAIYIALQFATHVTISNSPRGGIPSGMPHSALHQQQLSPFCGGGGGGLSRSATSSFARTNSATAAFVLQGGGPLSSGGRLLSENGYVAGGGSTAHHVYSRPTPTLLAATLGAARCSAGALASELANVGSGFAAGRLSINRRGPDSGVSSLHRFALERGGSSFTGNGTATTAVAGRGGADGYGMGAVAVSGGGGGASATVDGGTVAVQRASTGLGRDSRCLASFAPQSGRLAIPPPLAHIHRYGSARKDNSAGGAAVLDPVQHQLLSQQLQLQQQLVQAAGKLSATPVVCDPVGMSRGGGRLEVLSGGSSRTAAAGDGPPPSTCRPPADSAPPHMAQSSLFWSQQLLQSPLSDAEQLQLILHRAPLGAAGPSLTGELTCSGGVAPAAAYYESTTSAVTGQTAAVHQAVSDKASPVLREGRGNAATASPVAGTAAEGSGSELHLTKAGVGDISAGSVRREVWHASGRGFLSS